MNGNEWRRVVAALTNDKSRLAFAEAVLAQAAVDGVSLTDTERQKALTGLENAQILTRKQQGHEFNLPYARELLATPDGSNARRGLDRFMNGGRIDRYPANKTQRYELLQWISQRVLGPGEVLDEPTLNERLGAHTDDTAVLRRYLVDAGLLERTTRGTAYALASP